MLYGAYERSQPFVMLNIRCVGLCFNTTTNQTYGVTISILVAYYTTFSKRDVFGEGSSVIGYTKVRLLKCVKLESASYLFRWSRHLFRKDSAVRSNCLSAKIISILIIFTNFIFIISIYLRDNRVLILLRKCRVAHLYRDSFAIISCRRYVI